MAGDSMDETGRWNTNGHSTNYHQPIPRYSSSLSPKLNGHLPTPATATRDPSSLSSLLRFLLPSKSHPHVPEPSPHPQHVASMDPPSSQGMVRFVILCALWYTSSALSSNTGKQIMNQFKYPVTLTFVQFGFVSGYCLLFANPWYGWTKIRPPTVAILTNTLPMAVFQVGGHIFSSMAISRVPVSTVHTIKALSPLFTVAAYALLFGVRYSPRTYVSLLPLTFGVMLACSFDLNFDNALGLICAFGSAIVFVSSNIVFKKLMPSPSSNSSLSPAVKLDKLNLLFYSSGLAFLLMIPLWVWSDLGRLLDHDHHPPAHHLTPKHGVMYYFFMNGTVHWAQNIIAFAILSSTSPVTYSIASLIKRIAVILIAIAWFNQSLHPVQSFGICLTFVGLWMYNAAKADVELGEKRMRKVEARLQLTLPVTAGQARAMDITPAPSPSPERSEWERAGMPNYSVSSAIPKHAQPTRQRGQSFANASLAPPMRMGAHHGHGHGVGVPHTAPLRVDTQTKEKEGQRHAIMSPTEPYPSPPDSPPLQHLDRGRGLAIAI